MRWDNQRLFWLLAIVAVVVRLLVAVLPGNRLEPPWSGGSDSQHYATLAQNLLEGEVSLIMVSQLPFVRLSIPFCWPQ